MAAVQRPVGTRVKHITTEAVGVIVAKPSEGFSAADDWSSWVRWDGTDAVVSVAPRTLALVLDE